MTKAQFSTEDMQFALDSVFMYGNYKKASAETGIPSALLSLRHAEAVKQGLTASATAMSFINDIKEETVSPKLWTGTRDECIDDIKRVCQGQGGRVNEKSYNDFGVYHEDVWRGHFHSFRNFMVAAHLTATAHQKRHTRLIEAQYDAAAYDAENQFRSSLGGKFDRPVPTKGRVKFMAISDLHDRMCDPFYRRVVIETARDMQPDIIIMAGDIYDCYEFSSYDKESKWMDTVGAFQWCLDFFRDLREAAPDAQIDLLEGNHELRLWKSIVVIPQLRSLLGDWKATTIPELLDLDLYQVNYIGKTSLALPTRENYKSTKAERSSKVYMNAFLADHYPSGSKSALPGFNGHHHKHVVTALSNEIFGAYEWHQLGCGHILRCDYGTGGQKWTLGFLTGYVDLGYQNPRTQFLYWDIFDYAVINGNEYARRPEERVSVDSANAIRK